jgi:hypothetical protein
MISKKEITEKLRELLSKKSISDEEQLNNALQQFLIYLFENYDQLDDEAKDLCDKTTNSLLENAKTNIYKLPESVEKRKLIRILAKAKNMHYSSELLVQVLEDKNEDMLPLLKDTRDFFIKWLQIILDFLFDEANKKQSGLASYAKLSIFYLCVDELLAAFHLAQHHFINQG